MSERYGSFGGGASIKEDVCAWLQDIVGRERGAVAEDDLADGEALEDGCGVVIGVAVALPLDDFGEEVTGGDGGIRDADS